MSVNEGTTYGDMATKAHGRTCRELRKNGHIAIESATIFANKVTTYRSFSQQNQAWVERAGRGGVTPAVRLGAGTAVAAGAAAVFVAAGADFSGSKVRSFA